MEQKYPTVSCSRCNFKFNENNLNMLYNIEEIMDYEKKMLVNELKDRYSSSTVDIKKRISDLPNYIICDSCEAHHYRYYLEKLEPYLNKKKEERQYRILFVYTVIVIFFNTNYEQISEGVGFWLFKLGWNSFWCFSILYLIMGLGRLIDTYFIKNRLSHSKYERIKIWGESLPYLTNFRWILPITILFVLLKFNYLLN